MMPCQDARISRRRSRQAARPWRERRRFSVPVPEVPLWAYPAGVLLLLRIVPGSSYVVDVLPAVTVFGLGLALLVAPLTTTVRPVGIPQTSIVIDVQSLHDQMNTGFAVSLRHLKSTPGSNTAASYPIG